MTEKNEKGKKTLSLKPSGNKLDLLKKKNLTSQEVRSSSSKGKMVMVEVKPNKRAPKKPASAEEIQITTSATNKPSEAEAAKTTSKKDDGLTDAERETRAKALQLALKSDSESKRMQAIQEIEEDAKVKREEDKKRAEEEAQRKAEEEAAKKQLEVEQQAAAAAKATTAPADASADKPAAKDHKKPKPAQEQESEKKPLPKVKKEPKRRTGKLTIAQALEGDPDEERQRSLASLRRAREKEKQKMAQNVSPKKKQVREVIVPDTITVQELANRMAEKGTEIIKCLMGMGVMATINQAIDADTAELVVSEFGHKVKRVSEADVEIGLGGEEDKETDLVSRSPIVTVMGHVDHGKTSLLDALRQANVVDSEAGGITQHIGAYQVATKDGHKITFLDTPGHEAFTAMRARGTNVTDVVVLVVAADDGIQPQTIEAIAHAKAAEVPIIVAINKIDKPEANPDKIKTDLLSHEVQVESMGGEILDVEISAKQKTNLEQLVDAIVLQAEMQDLRANPGREAQGMVVEASLDKGRGPVATILIQRGTLKIGDNFIVGDQSGRVRAMIDDKGQQVKEAGPSVPVEVLGLNGTPGAGDDFYVVENDAKAREITEFRQRKKLEQKSLARGRASLEQIFSNIGQGKVAEVPLIVKADVHGSVEAICASLDKLATDEVKPLVIHSGVGVINETDINLAQASSAIIVGFNVRPTSQARNLAQEEGIDIRYYSIIYDLLEEAKQIMAGKLDPIIEEVFLGRAEVREIFNISKVGRVAGCRVVEGTMRRDTKLNLVRDGIVVHEGQLKSLRNVKKDVSEMKEGFECGITIEDYQDIHQGDMIECYEITEKKREL